MKLRTVTAIGAILAVWFLAACGGGGGVIDGGQSGTGLSTIRGNVVAAPGQTLDPADIRVSLSATDLETVTDQTGRFELSGEVSGPGELHFERERDALLASTDVFVPAGGLLELAEIVLDPESGEARPALRRVEFEGFIESLNCAAGEIFVIPKEDEDGDIFIVETASATIRHDNQPLGCDDLLVGDRVQIDAETTDGVTLVNADVRLEDREDSEDDGADDEKDDSEHDSEDDDSEDGEEDNGSGDEEDDSVDDSEGDDSEDDEENDSENDGSENEKDDSEDDSGDDHSEDGEEDDSRDDGSEDEEHDSEDDSED
jgi:hypothetical protein